MAKHRRNALNDGGGLRLLSAVRGRQRWEVSAILRRPDMAQELADALLQYPGILEVKANAGSGRVLILYAPGTPGLEIETPLQDCLKTVLARKRQRSPAAGAAGPLSRILRTTLPERRQLIKPPVLSAISQSVHILQAFAVIGTINTAQGQGPSFLQKFGLKRQGSRLLFMTALSMTLAGFDILLQYYRQRAWRRLGQEAKHRLRTKVIARIETQDLEFFDEHGTGQLINLVATDTSHVGDFVERAGDALIERALTVIVSSVGLFLASGQLLFLILLPLPFVFLPFRVLRQRAAEYYARMGRASDSFSQMLENSLSGIAVIKSFTAERQETRRLRDTDWTVAEAAFEAGSVSSLLFQIGNATFYFSSSMMAGYAGQLLSKGKLTTSQYTRAIYWFPQLLGAITGIEEITRLYYSAESSAERLAKVLDSRPKIRSGPLRLRAADVRGEVIFENVSFGYHPDFKVLEGISFHLRPGETLGIVGPTGSGKSTLLRLLLRFYEVGSGRIFLDGRDIRELNLRDLRQSISLVSQDVYLFPGTVRDNVLYSREFSEDELMTAMQDARATNLLATLPAGLDTEVGEHGRRLSGGERQRVAIARAVIKGAPILALDEATSHLDYETEFAVKRSLRKAASGKSVIMIAHRLSTIRDADRIIVLEHGKVSEIGSHDDLLARRGLYASLWEFQNGSYPEE